MSDNGSKPVDLASILRPIKIDAGPLGVIVMPVRTAAFLRWFEAGEAKSRWCDGATFVRAMLAEQANEGKDRPVNPALVAGLDERALERIAETIVTSVGSTLILSGRHRPSGDEPVVPHQGPDPAVEETEPRTNGEGTSARETGPAVARLLAMVRAYFEHHRSASRRMLERMHGDDSLATMRRAMDEASGNNIARALGQSIGDLGFKRNFASGFLAGRPEVIRSLDRLGSTAFFKEHTRIAERIAEITAPLGALASSATFKPLIEPSLRAQIMGDQMAWARTINSEFALGMSATVLRDIGRVQSGSASAAQAIAAAIGSARLTMPGFELTATLALDGLVAAGAAADVLQYYERAAAARGETFSAIVEAIRQLDDDDGAVVDVEGTLERIWNTVAAHLTGRLPHLDAAGWLALAALIVAVAALQLDLENGRDAAKNSQTIQRIEQDIAGSRADARAAREADANERRFIRYVHATANLRAEPVRTGLLIRKVYPDQLIRVIDTNGEWARVEVFDYASETPLKGWINRRVLRVFPAN